LKDFNNAAPSVHENMDYCSTVTVSIAVQFATKIKVYSDAV